MRSLLNVSELLGANIVTIDRLAKGLSPDFRGSSPASYAVRKLVLSMLKAIDDPNVSKGVAKLDCNASSVQVPGRIVTKDLEQEMVDNMASVVFPAIDRVLPDSYGAGDIIRRRSKELRFFLFDVLNARARLRRIEPLPRGASSALLALRGAEKGLGNMGQVTWSNIDGKSANMVAPKIMPQTDCAHIVCMPESDCTRMPTIQDIAADIRQRLKPTAPAK